MGLSKDAEKTGAEWSEIRWKFTLDIFTSFWNFIWGVFYFGCSWMFPKSFHEFSWRSRLFVQLQYTLIMHIFHLIFGLFQVLSWLRTCFQFFSTCLFFNRQEFEKYMKNFWRKVKRWMKWSWVTAEVNEKWTILVKKKFFWQRKVGEKFFTGVLAAVWTKVEKKKWELFVRHFKQNNELSGWNKSLFIWTIL